MEDEAGNFIIFHFGKQTQRGNVRVCGEGVKENIVAFVVATLIAQPSVRPPLLRSNVIQIVISAASIVGEQSIKKDKAKSTTMQK